jgi:Fe(3+) dicitrate transport protein
MSVSGLARTGLSLLALGLTATAASAADKPTPVAPVNIRSQRPEDTRAKLEHIQREVDGVKLTVTRKSSVTLLDHTPSLPDENVRELFVRTPGVLAAEPAVPTTAALAYRGLGAAPGAQGLLVLLDGLPLEADFMGEPQLDDLPFSQSLAQVQTLRGGSSLVYGPQAAAINLVSRRPQPGEPLGFVTEQVGGSNGLWSSWNALEGSQGRFDYRADLGWVRSNGERANSASTVGQADAWLGFRPAKSQLWYLALQARRASAGDPGPMGLAQFTADPGAATTPFDHDWLERYSATLGTELDLGKGWRLEGKLRAAYEDLYQRAVTNPAAGATLQDSLYRSQDLDLRLKKSWGRGNAFTVGVDAFHDEAPLRQWTGGALDADPGERAGAAASLRQARKSDYQAVFAENVFRLPHRIHVVPSVRLEH